jgi:hypothetical protein
MSTIREVLKETASAISIAAFIEGVAIVAFIGGVAVAFILAIQP